MNKNRLKEMLYERPFLCALAKVLKHHNDKRFLDRVNNTKPEFYLASEAFHLSKGRTYYVIERDWGINGFFAIMSFCLLDFAVADSLGFIPYVNINRSLYNVEGGWNGINNMFEYYFVQPFPDSVERIKGEENYFYANYENRAGIRRRFQAQENYNYTDEQLRYLGTIAKKYMHLRPELEKELHQEIINLLGDKRTLGIHFRGSDFRMGFKNHPIALTIEQYIPLVEEAMQNGFEQIFLATDDKAAAKAFCQRFGNKVVMYQNVMRTDGNVGVHMLDHQENERYYRGLEVLRDMCTLAACSGMLAGVSNVSKFAQIWKYAHDAEFDLLKIIRNGTYDRHSSDAKKILNKHGRK